MNTRKTDPFAYRRRPARVVHIGDLPIGGDHPIRVQSMTTPPTTDTRATVEQICRLVEAGCEIVRVTVPTSADADNLPEIRSELERRKVHVPLVADIHFTPAAAMRAVEHVDKIRINPGNFADKKKFAVLEYTDAEYSAELERIERAVLPLIERCKELGRSMRIGTNHGSLSDRIMNRFGDTAEGMVESALEFVRICEAHDFRELVLSMKASNPVVVLQAYRLLDRRMSREGMDYPIHLGVTEAGDGEDGRIKSAIGIGVLLDEGIGDTVRVSLTEDPVREIPVAQALVAPYNARLGRAPESPGAGLRTGTLEVRDPASYSRRVSRETAVGPLRLGGSNPVAVEVPLAVPLGDREGLRRDLDAQVGARVPEETRAELVSVRLATWEELGALEDLRRSLEMVAPAVALSVRVDRLWTEPVRESLVAELAGATHRIHLTVDGETAGRRHALRAIAEAAAGRDAALLVEATSAGLDVEEAVGGAVEAARWVDPFAGSRLLLTLDPRLGASPMMAIRRLSERLAETGLQAPLVLLDRPLEREASPLLQTSLSLGGLLCDGIGDSIHIDAGTSLESRRLAFSILQAARVRMTRTEFISCPSCGRTLFDLESTTARIKARTSHLKNVKIAVMGCVVNGPGEMADADFGYVGWGENKIALFVGKEMVEKDIPTGQAEQRLVALIRRHGKWVDPPAGG